MILRGLREGSPGHWHLTENKPLGASLFGAFSGYQGDSGVFGAPVAGAVVEAMVLAAEGERAALLTSAGQIGAPLMVESGGVVNVAKGLTGKCTGGAGSALMEDGAEAWHQWTPAKEKTACRGGLFLILSPYY
jgi:hypothetical protein